MGAWILLQSVEGLCDFSSDVGRQGEELFAGARLKENLVGHLSSKMDMMSDLVFLEHVGEGSAFFIFRLFAS